MDEGGKQVWPHNPVFRALKMVVAKSEVRRDAATYFRAARPWPSLITVLGLGYFAVRFGIHERFGPPDP